MEQAPGSQFQLADGLTQLVFDGFGGDMKTPGNFFYRQSGFTTVEEDEAAMLRQLFHFLPDPFQDCFVMEGCFDPAFGYWCFSGTPELLFAFPDIPFNPVEYGILNRNSQVIFRGINMSRVTVRPECSKYIVNNIFSSGAVLQTVIGDNKQLFPVALIKLIEGCFIIPGYQVKQLIWGI